MPFPMLLWAFGDQLFERQPFPSERGERPPHARQLDAQAYAPDLLHVERVEPAYGDFYGRCSCGAISLPYWSAEAAQAWRCPREAAECEVDHARRRWNQRVFDAAGVRP